MKNRLSLGLLGLLLVALLVYSCRNDYLQEQKVNEEVSVEKSLTKKIIRLNESKHSKQLKSVLKESKQSLIYRYQYLAKTIIVSEDITINTDRVVYMEKGNFCTYTFYIENRFTKPEDPIENLVIVPLLDGSFKEFIVSYYLREDEKEIIRTQELYDIDLTANVKELTSEIDWYAQLDGEYNCNWNISTVNVPCSCEPKHTSLAGCTCSKGKAYTFMRLSITCDGTNDPVDGYIGEPPSGGGGGVGGGYCPTCTSPSTGDCEIIPNELQDESSLESANGCTLVIPTLPNLGEDADKTPCEKTKDLLENPEVQVKVDSLKQESKTPGEKAFKIKADGTTSALIDGGEHHVKLVNMSGYIGYYHNHTPRDGIKVFSTGDIYGLFKTIISNTDSVGIAFAGIVASEPCNCPPENYIYHNFIIRFNGDMQQAGAIYNANYDFDKLEKDYQERANILTNNSMYVDSFYSTDLNAKGLERLLFDTLALMNIDSNQIALQRIDDDGTVKNVNLDSNGVPQEEPCP